MTQQPSPVALAAGAEFDAIRLMVARWGNRAVGIGDDAAIVQVPRGDALVASVDSSIEQRHFRSDWLNAREIGYRAVTAALSDLAAMAALPLGILVALTLPESRRGEIEALADGIGEAVTAAGTVVLGGNVTAGDTLGLTTTVLGYAFAPLKRSGLAAGDTLYVTGRFGGPGAALASWRSGHRLSDLHRERFARPVARLREARWLADWGATAAIDVSDGLASDLEQLAVASGVGIDVDLAAVPLVEGVNGPIAAAASGEEYELIVGARSPMDTGAFERAFGTPLTVIGHATAADGGVIFRQGAQRVAKPRGYDHLSR